MDATLPAHLQAFFTDRLLAQRQVSTHTIASYRDCFRLLLAFAKQHLGKSPSSLMLEDLDAGFIGRFLEHLESERGNRARTRNARLAAIHSFFRYVALNEPSLALHCQRVLAIPNKRHERKSISFLNEAEMDALLAAPNPSSWTGRRDRTLLLLALQTGMRVSEIIGLRCKDVMLGTGAHVQCHGKGRKHRCTPLRKDAVKVLAAWLKEKQGSPSDPVFTTTRGGAMSRDAIEWLVAKHANTALKNCQSLKSKTITPHTLRHCAAMDLLRHGVDRSVIAMWLGHESVETTQIYLHADMAMKEQAIARTAPRKVNAGRYKPSDELLAFLESL